MKRGGAKMRRGGTVKKGGEKVKAGGKVKNGVRGWRMAVVR